tara:strand:+ start:515 stop:712 length:198 start_codon:yes stop_codon:yes gene_type:complete
MHTPTWYNPNWKAIADAKAKQHAKNAEEFKQWGSLLEFEETVKRFPRVQGESLMEYSRRMKEATS